MTTTEFVAAQRLLGLTDDELAGELGVTPAVVRAWATGRIGIPRSYARDIAFRAALAERRTALKASGLPECPWMLADERTPFPDDADELEAKGEEDPDWYQEEDDPSDRPRSTVLPPLPSPGRQQGSDNQQYDQPRR